MFYFLSIVAGKNGLKHYVTMEPIDAQIDRKIIQFFLENKTNRALHPTT